MSLRETINRNEYLHGVKRLITPLWTSINGRTGQDRWLWEMRVHGKHAVSTILDVGSSEGFFLGKAAVHFPRASYHHFEPRPEAAAGVKKLAARLGTASQVHELALADEKGTAKFAVMGYGDASSLLVTTRGVGTSIARQIDVAVDTLDAFIDGSGIQEIGLLKIDVEGVERRVLLGAKKTLSERVASVILEISPLRHAGGASETLEVFALMLNAGFSLVDTYHCDYLFTKDAGVLAQYHA